MVEKLSKNALKTVAIAEDDSAVSTFLKTLATHSGYTLVGQVSNGADAVSLVRAAGPQLLLLDLHLPVLDGMQVLRQVTALESTAVVMITADTDPAHAREALDLGACGYLLKPCEAAQIVPLMESAWHRFQTIHALRQETRELQDTLATRKLIDQAKGILMEQQGFTEEQAHRLLQKMSQDQGIAIKDVCRSLIQVKMVFGRNAARGAKTYPKS